MCAMPERRRDPIHDEFYSHFSELQKDLLSIQQILHTREKSGASFDTIAKELESLKEDAQNRWLNLNRIWINNANLFPKDTGNYLNQCQKFINDVHPEILSQEKWAFNNKWLNKFKNILGY